MQEFEVYSVPPCACDSEWELLSTVQAETETDALTQARKIGKCVRQGTIVCIPIKRIASAVVGISTGE